MVGATNARDNGVYHYLDCSTQHLSPAEADRLADAPWIVREFSGDRMYWVAWVHVVETDDYFEEEQYEGFASLRGIVSYARRLGCTWVLLDSDGYVHSDLPTYDWD